MLATFEGPLAPQSENIHQLLQGRGMASTINFRERDPARGIWVKRKEVSYSPLRAAGLDRGKPDETKKKKEQALKHMGKGNRRAIEGDGDRMIKLHL